jgi:hypothetical protein
MDETVIDTVIETVIEMKHAETERHEKRSDTAAAMFGDDVALTRWLAAAGIGATVVAGCGDLACDACQPVPRAA